MSERRPIRVIIIARETSGRQSLAHRLMAFDEVQLVGQALDSEEAIQLCRLAQPDVTVLDLTSLPQPDGITTIQVIHQRWPAIRILALGYEDQNGLLPAAMEAGATGHLSLNSAAEDLTDAIVQIYEGQPLEALGTRAVAQTDHLKLLAQEIQTSALDKSSVLSLLEKHLPKIIPHCQVLIRTFPGQEIISYPLRLSDPPSEPAWEWLRSARTPHTFLPGAAYPWGGSQGPGSALILVPIPGSQETAPAGGIAIVYRRSLDDLPNLLPIAHSLAALLGSALDKVRRQEKKLAQQAVTRELATAGQIQTGILPDHPPTIRGWDLAARLEAARETSGDFYDFIPLANHKWGIVIADVTDKGMGAALFMVLSNTLIRTYAAQYPVLPALAMSTVNQRILSDTRGSMFVTAFYGVLEPDTGRMRYVNAGHNPPLLFTGPKKRTVERLRGTGMALGVVEDTYWQQKIIKLNPGDVLVMYTDGVVEAQNRHGRYFGEQRLIDVIRGKLGSPAHVIQEAVLAELDDFKGDLPRHDDVTLVVLMRDEES